MYCVFIGVCIFDTVNIFCIIYIIKQQKGFIYDLVEEPSNLSR